MRFTHLHVHTEYSLLDGSNKIKEYIARVKELGMTSCAITDHGVMYGCIDFYKAAWDEGIKPIIGCEVYVAPESRFEKGGAGSRGSAANADDKYHHLILLAENNQGYANLMKIVSAGFVEGYYYRPRVDKELLRKYHEGIIASSACLAGEIAKLLMRGEYEEAKKTALEYREIFGENNFFLELMDHGIPEQKRVNQLLKEISRETGIPMIVTNDAHYTFKEDAEPHDILLCIQTGKKVQDEDRMRYTGGQYYIKSAAEMAALFPDVPEALENTSRIADRCNVEIVFHERKLPKYDLPPGRQPFEYLESLCEEGLKKRYPDVTREIEDQLHYELSTIRSMGFVDYFLIVWDFIKYARDHGIAVGPGRGSAAGSIVSYSLGITQLDPLKYNLLFERFLNPERVSMPDIDVDFDPERRQEVIEYVMNKYGRDKCVQIVTFGTLKARNVIRDVGRVLDMSYGEVDVIAKMIPMELGITIDKAMKMNPELAAAYEEQENIKYLIDMAKRLEGLPRHTSMHAAGVLICQNQVDDYVPLSVAADGTITTQYTMTTLEELGLLKMDFLGLRNLTVIQNAESLVNANIPEGGQKLDIDRIDLSEPNVLNMIGKGDTEGIFQLESAGMTSFMKELRPERFEDIIAGIALYRPGPMDFIPKYLAGKRNAASVTYDCPELMPILEPTYGCIVYQEQVMQIVQELGGYTLGRADLVRRAMSKKKESVMIKERKNFVYGNPAEGVPGCLNRGISEDVANKIFDEMMDFAKYAFNKSHAAVYAYVAMQTGYLKYYHPVEYMAALMTSVIGAPAKCAEYILHCHDRNIEILPPSVNEGEGVFTAEGGKIRYGMYAIKHVGRPAVDAIVRERKKGGPYTSLKDFLSRVESTELNRRAIENLIKAGALDGLGGNRRQLMMAFPLMLEDVAREKKESISGQFSIFDFMQPEDAPPSGQELPDVAEFRKEEILAFEKDVMGVYLSGHPLEEEEHLWRKTISAQAADFAPAEETDEDDPAAGNQGFLSFENGMKPENGQQAGGRSGRKRLWNGEKEIIGGLMTGKTIKFTKNNKPMAFITLEDLTGSVEVLVFPQTYERYSEILNPDEKLFAEGKVSVEDEKASKLLADRIWRFSDVPRELWLRFPDKEAYEAAKEELAAVLRSAPGNSRVNIYLKDRKAVKKLPLGEAVQTDPETMERLRKMLGAENVKLV
ncbi:MAG: DNA polymerase III subunit alpha [Lachnospiraceae bacterium]|nr:DNA polymerase III subunit alpha [Lachnospiraceae bacterium]